MAEVVGLIAAGAQLLQLTFEVISLVKGLSSEIQDELGSGAWQLSQADALLALARNIQENSSPIIAEPLRGCLKELKFIHSKLMEVSAGSRQGRLNRLMMAVKFKAGERDIVVAWKRIEDKLKLLSLALQWKSLLVVDEISMRGTPTQIHHAQYSNEGSSPANSNRIYNFQPYRYTTHALVGRVELLETLLYKLGIHGMQTRVALHGLGGIGKSRMAHECALRIIDQVPDTWVFWIRANTKTQFVQDYLGMASYLKLTSGGSSPTSVEDVSQCLRYSNFGNWVMIVDNVDDCEILDGEMPVVDLIPDNPRGSVIYTTRSKGIASRLTSIDNVIPVGNLEPNEARDLFCINLGLKYSEIRATEQVSIGELLQSLNYLPLAICHAGSYMSSQQIDSSEYLNVFNMSEDAKANLLDDDDFPQATLRFGPVLRTLAISLEHIAKLNPGAADILSFMACVASKGIPRLLLPAADDTNCITMHSFLKAVGLLKSYSLITFNNYNQTFDMHDLVHLATRRWLRSKNKFQCWIQKALLSLFKHFPNAPSYESRNLPECARYLPCAEAFLCHKEFPPEFDEQRCLLGHRCSHYLRITGRFGHAEWFSNISADLSASAFGIDDPAHFTKQEDHATVLRQNGRFTAAIKIERAVLANRRRVLEADHGDIFSSLNNLGLSLLGLGQYSEAEELHRCALNGWRDKFGEEDSHTLASLNNLSLSLERQRKFPEAEKLARHAVLIKLKIYGRENLSTLLSFSNLALCLQEQEKFDEAQELHAEVLRARERQLGEHHPQTLNSKQGLIRSMIGNGQFERTESMARNHLAVTSGVLGAQHDQTLWMTYYLATVLLMLGKHEEAETHARNAFEARKAAMGIDHRDTKTCESLLYDILDRMKRNGPKFEPQNRVLSLQDQTYRYSINIFSCEGESGRPNAIQQQDE